MANRPRGEELLLGALAAGGSVEQAARAAGVSVRTAYRRLACPGFRTRLASARDELISAALGELVGCAAEAVATLRQLLQADDERVRLTAARAILEQLLRLRETITLAQRLASLERNLQQRQRGGRR
jgi:molybdenum-dependent DNA-binding transcriptional regulator ModE